MIKKICFNVCFVLITKKTTCYSFHIIPVPLLQIKMLVNVSLCTKKCLNKYANMH